ncbi:MAG TPA: DUF945 family protein [Gammaproteobacteria bacterium]
MKIRVKKTRIVLLAAVLLLVGLPPVFGMLTEAAVLRRAESLRDEGRLRVTVESFDRGWFTSQAVLSIEPDPAGDPRQALIGFVEPMTVVVDFKHGPLSVHDGLFFGFSELRARPAVGPSGEPIDAPFDFEFRAQSTFGGSVNFAAEIQPFDSAGEGFALSFSGGSLHGTLAGARVRAVLRTEALQYTQGTTTYSLLGLRANADTERVGDRVMPGTVTLEIDRMAMDVGDADRSTVFDLRALAVDSSTALDGSREHLGGRLSIVLGRLRLADDTEIAGARLHATAERLDVAALDAYSAAAARAAENGAPLADEVEPAVLRLLAAGPRASIDALHFEVDGEPFDAVVRAAADPAALPAGAADIRDPALWAAVLDGRAEVTVAKSLAENAAVAIAKSQLGSRVRDGESMPGRSLEALARTQAQLALAVLSAQGLLEETGNVYRTVVQLEDGRLSVNDRSVPFIDVLGSLAR